MLNTFTSQTNEHFISMFPNGIIGFANSKVLSCYSFLAFQKKAVLPRQSQSGWKSKKHSQSQWWAMQCPKPLSDACRFQFQHLSE